MDINALISTNGFPIAAAIALFYFIRNDLKDLNENLDKLNITIFKLETLIKERLKND